MEKGDRSSGGPKSREEEKPRGAGEGEHEGYLCVLSSSSSSGVRIGGARRDGAAWGLEKGRLRVPLPNHMVTRVLANVAALIPRGRAVHVVIWPTWQTDGRLSHRRIQGRHDVWGPDCLLHMSGWPARLPASRCDGGPGAAPVAISSSGASGRRAPRSETTAWRRWRSWTEGAARGGCEGKKEK